MIPKMLPYYFAYEEKGSSLLRIYYFFILYDYLVLYFLLQYILNKVLKNIVIKAVR